MYLKCSGIKAWIFEIVALVEIIIHLWSSYTYTLITFFSLKIFVFVNTEFVLHMCNYM